MRVSRGIADSGCGSYVYGEMFSTSRVQVAGSPTSCCRKHHSAGPSKWRSALPVLSWIVDLVCVLKQEEGFHLVLPSHKHGRLCPIFSTWYIPAIVE